MAYHAASRRTVLFGGRVGGTAVNDTWEWDGTSWTQLAPATSPSARFDHEMAYDPIRRRVVAYAGFSAGTETWEWDGTTWSPGPTSPNPGSRYAYAFAYDSRSHRVLFFGGYQGGQRSDTWTYGAGVTATYVTAGVGCQGQGGLPTIAANAGSLPYLGETFVALASNLSANGLVLGILGFSDTQWGAIGLPLDLGFLGMTGCRLYVAVDAVFPLVNNGGSALWSLPIPSGPHFVGVRFFQQVVNGSQGSNPAGLTSSRYGIATIGVR
jgi:hypothetical protein